MKTRFYVQKLFILSFFLLGIGFNAFSQNSTFNYTGAIQTYTVPAGVTFISISGSGAAGGDVTDFAATGGNGAIMSGVFAVTPGQVLNLLVGQKPASVAFCAGGGGGTFIWDASNTLLLAAGGGGGAGYNFLSSGINGVDATTAIDGVPGNTMPDGAGIAGHGATTPGAAVADYGGGGTGWLSPGNSGNAGSTITCSSAGGGATPLSGGAGGVFGGTGTFDGNGGFGGGGGGQGRCSEAGGGGGGGYSGGGAGGELVSAISVFQSGGGGGSFNGGAIQQNSVGNTGNGIVTISVVYPPTYIHGSPQSVSACSNTSLDISGLLAITDSTPGETEVWMTTLAPANGLLNLPTTGIYTGDTLTPSGVTYTPNPGFTGNDTFSVTVLNELGASTTTTIYVTVNPLPAGIIGTGFLCAGASTPLTDGDSGGTWSSGNVSVATIDPSGTLFTVGAGTATISYTNANGCSATAIETVNPVPYADQVSVSPVCNGSLTNIIYFTDTIPGTTFSWTSDTFSIGLPAASGVDSIRSFQALNPADTAVTATITVIPATSTCTGDAMSFTITVKPTPSVSPIGSQTVCNGIATTAVTFGGSGVDATSYNWINNKPAIGLAASGTGNIDAFTATNGDDTIIVATIVVTPVADGCSGATQTFSITVNPTPNPGPSDNQIVCNGLPTASVIFTSSVAGSTYTWVNADTTIGLASSGTDSIPSFTATNDSSFSVTSSITVTASANGCPGTSNSFTIKVNPTPTLNSLLVAPSVCNNTPFTYTATSATTGTNFSWSRDSVAGISNSSTTGGTDIDETLINTTPNQVQVTYVYALEASSCVDTQDVKVLVSPTPVLTSTLTATVCDSALFSYTSISSTPSATFTWSRAAVLGISNMDGSGSGVINERLVNTTNLPVTVIYIDTITAFRCSNTESITVTVNPLPVLTTNTTPPAICSNTAFTYVPASNVDVTTFSWSRAAITGISNMAASGGDTIMETLINTAVDPISVVYVDTLKAYGCINTENINVTVNPKPVLTSALTATGICDSALFNYTPASATTGTTYAWVRPFVLGIALPAASGTGSISDTLYNTSNSNVTVTYDYTLTANGCSNTQDVTVEVHPIPTLSSAFTESVCSGATFRYVPIDSGRVFGTTYTWVRPHVAGILSATNSGSNNVISEVLTDTAMAPLQTMYVFTLTANGCTHIQVLNVTVNPAPPVAQITTHSPAAVCSNTRLQNFGTSTPAPAGQQYSWSAQNATIWATGTDKQYILVSFPTQGTSVITLNANLAGFACTSSSTYTVNVSGSTADMPEVIYYNGQFSCLQNNVDNYQWGYDDAHTLDSTLVEGEVNQTYFISGPDFNNRYYWVITNHDGCMQKSYYNAPTGITNINEGEHADIKVYPNPASNMINVDVNTTAAGSIEVEVLNMLGQKVSTTLATDHKAQISVASLPAGCYLVDCYSNGVKLGATRFIKN